MQRTDISKLREETFKEETLGNLGAFYRDTAKAYEQKMLEENKKLDSLQRMWENRFIAAEEAFKENQAFKVKRKPGLPMFVDPITGKRQRLFAVLDEQGKRRSFDDILKEDTSRRGNIFELGMSSKEIIQASNRTAEYSQMLSTYESRFKEEQNMLAERNAKAREKFLAEKQKKLEELSASAYKQATYIEKPI